MRRIVLALIALILTTTVPGHLRGWDSNNDRALAIPLPPCVAPPPGLVACMGDRWQS